MSRNIFIIFLIIVLLVAGLTGLYRGEKQAPAAPSAEPTTPPPAEVQPPPAEEPATPTESVKKPEPPPAPPVQRKLMERPHSVEHAAVLQVAAALQEDEAPAAQGEQQKALEALIREGKVAPEAAETLREWAKEHPDFKVEEIGTVISETEGEKETRYRLVSKQGGDDMVVSVSTPQKGKPVITAAQKQSSDRTQVTVQSDAISVVEGFVEALKRGDMGMARRMTIGKDVSDATLAGLCMMFEEGDFTMRKNVPIRNMFRSGENSGFLIYMSPQDGSRQSRNIGIEMTYSAETGWRVKAVALDDLLNRYEESGAAEGGVFFPLVKSPQGGDSLVLYFGYDDASLSPRSLSQIKIVARLLSDTKGKLSISGHTDDIGSVGYNKDLSVRRAEAVKAALIEFGVSPEQITTQGMGKSQPRRTYKLDDTEQTINTIRSGNRRAEIYLDF